MSIRVGRDYGLISQKQRDHTGDSFGTGLTNPDLLMFADSFGIERYRPESSEQLRAALRTAVDGGMSLLAVPVE